MRSNVPVRAVPRACLAHQQAPPMRKVWLQVDAVTQAQERSCMDRTAHATRWRCNWRSEGSAPGHRPRHAAHRNLARRVVRRAWGWGYASRHAPVDRRLQLQPPDCSGLCRDLLNSAGRGHGQPAGRVAAVDASSYGSGKWARVRVGEVGTHCSSSPQLGTVAAGVVSGVRCARGREDGMIVQPKAAAAGGAAGALHWWDVTVRDSAPPPSQTLLDEMASATGIR